MTSETDLTESIITNNTNIVNDTAEGSSGDSNHVVTSVSDSIPEATETVGQSTDTNATSGTVNTVTTQTSTNGLQASHVTPIRLRPATDSNPKQSRHDVCFSGLHSSTTTDDIRAYLIDIGVANIESIALITGNVNSKSACFRVIITDESIKHNVYDPKRCTDGISVLPYHFYKGDKKLQRNTTKSRQTNSTDTAQRTAAYARFHTDNESNTHGRRGSSPNAEQHKTKALESKQEMIVAQYGHHVVLDLTISQTHMHPDHCAQTTNEHHKHKQIIPIVVRRKDNVLGHITSTTACNHQILFSEVHTI